MTPLITELRAQRRSGAIIAPPTAPIVTDRRAEWRHRHAQHQATGQRWPLRLWRA